MDIPPPVTDLSDDANEGQAEVLTALCIGRCGLVEQNHVAASGAVDSADEELPDLLEEAQARSFTRGRAFSLNPLAIRESDMVSEKRHIRAFIGVTLEPAGRCLPPGDLSRVTCKKTLSALYFKSVCHQALSEP
ncbi:hypothetical protein AK812_SmicGene14402 [Symbiodinium microadriaticum]|uniref:Uncharacterized protein n=1 Tax=Symbiodinium microadriaticum TaxID=2951 RepID=A0A1Q9E5N0_SYMMI|nr:hypothetical protein AK812_SmicGene14402 [Symbiodinium microadriaticum]